ncbi:MAG: ribosome small subunit-dependent GTPase A [Clostridia bacterium]|nr:ribosome small subunit-dependent GTPase A [Clostridia bacterium]
MTKGIITKGVGGLYTVAPMEADGAPVLCRARGKFRLDGTTPLPGDEVLILPASEGDEIPEGLEVPDTDGKTGKKDDSAKESAPDGVDVNYVIREIRPRQNTLIRPPMANLTHLYVVLPCAAPYPDLLMADKLTAIAVDCGIRPVIIVNKADVDPDMGGRLTEIYTKAGFPVFLVSAASGAGVDLLEEYLFAEAAVWENAGQPMRAAFAGVSGAGKSTLMTRMYPDLALKTNTVSRKIERGRHTTRHVELYPVQAGGHTYYLADTPGFSMLDFTRFNLLPLENLPGAFPEFAECLGACRYTKCTHTREEGCAVLEKLRDGRIAKTRHENFITIGEEIRKKPQWKREKEEENPAPARTGHRRKR